MSGARGERVFLSQVLAEVDSLERGLKELSREETLCINSSPRDTKRVEDIEKNSSKNHPGDTGWEARERFLTDAPRALGPNGVTSQEQAGGREEDHQPTLGEAVGQDEDLCQEGW